MAKYDWNTFRNYVAFLAGELAPGTRHPHHDSEWSSCYHDAFLPWGHYHNNIVLFYHDSPITRSHFMDPTDHAIKGFYCTYPCPKLAACWSPPVKEASGKSYEYFTNLLWCSGYWTWSHFYNSVWDNGVCYPVAHETTILVPYLVVKSLQLNWRPAPVDFTTGARSSNELQWLDLKIRHQDSSPSDDHQGDMPYFPCAWYLSFMHFQLFRNDVQFHSSNLTNEFCLV